jgi:HK97 family phage portal protein
MNLTRRIASAVRAFWDWSKGSKLNYIYGQKTLAGTRVNETSSLTISALFAALNFLAGTLASLPKVIYRRLPGGGKTRAYEHPLYDRLHNMPNNSGMTAWQWIYTSIMHKYLWGNWYTYIDVTSYQKQELIPLLPDQTYPDPMDSNYFITRIGYGTNAKNARFPRSRILHIPHISLDGIMGRGVIHYARESLGLAKAQDEFAATFFGSGIHGGGFVEVDKPMNEETRKELQKDFNEKYGGLGHTWKAIFLAGGAKFKESEIDAQKAQALESRQFSVIEASRWTNLPPHILRELSRATFSNIEQQGLELVIYSLVPITTQIEQAMNITLFDAEERQTHYVKFELKGLLRGDLKTRKEFYESMIDRGVFNADMVLELEDMNPQPGGLGKIYMAPLNMVNKELIVSQEPLTIEAPRGEQSSSQPVIQQRTVQLVEYRTSALRRKLTIAYKKQFDTYGKQIVEKEVKAVRKAVEEMLSERAVTDFVAWLDEFYRKFPKEISARAAPLLSSYASAVLPVAQEEINNDSEIGTQYEAFQADYRENFTRRHVQSSHRQLRSVVFSAQEKGEDVAETVEQRLTEWEEKRPAKITMRESIRAESAFTKSVFALSGLAKIRSIAYGKNCPYCQALNGQVIGINEFFLTKGDFQPEGAERPLVVTGNRSHPPYHDGCDCGIGPG